MQEKMNSSIAIRNYGLDTLRSLAIILVFMHHFNWLTGTHVFGIFAEHGGIGVDLFFVLSGYLIGHQIFSALIRSPQTFSLKMFYMRRFLRTLPNYFVVLGLYFLIPSFCERPLITSFLKFATFTQNFGLTYGQAFSHAWSLCIEEQFYIVLPLAILLVYYMRSIRLGWIFLVTALITGILTRAILWSIYIKGFTGNISPVYASLIYYPTYSRLDGLLLGVSLALIKDFHHGLWSYLTSKGNVFLCTGIMGYIYIFYFFEHKMQSFSTVIYYFIVAISSAALTLSALSPCSYLYKIRIPGATTMATLSYAFYLTHKQLIHLSIQFLSHWGLAPQQLALVLTPLCILTSLIGAFLLYIIVEKPFLILRDKLHS